MLDGSIWLLAIAADEELWPDFLAICDCGGRLAGTESEVRAFAFVEQRAEAATGVKGRSIPVPYGGWTSEEGVPALARWCTRALPRPGAQHRYPARRPDGRGGRSRSRHTRGIRGACRRHRGPHRPGAARADVRGRHHSSSPQVPGGARGRCGWFPDCRAAARAAGRGLVGPAGRRRHSGRRHRARGGGRHCGGRRADGRRPP